MADQGTILSFADACEVVAEHARALLKRQPEMEQVALQHGLGRVLADVVTADRPQPPFNRAARDGFAGRAAEFARGRVRIAGTVRAGEQWASGELAPGTCVEIMTGAPVPPGADCVLMVEHAHLNGDTVSVQNTRSAGAGDHIVPAGSEAEQHAALLPPGTRLTPSGIAVAAACGHARLKVWRRPRVAILSTGDELVDVDAEPEPFQIRNSNSYALAAQVAAAGGEAQVHAPVPDRAEALQQAIAQAAATCDLLLLSGGVSAGRFDLVEPALLHCGAIFAFTRVRMQPGKPVVFGSLREGRIPFFGLPGNPVSVRACFTVFVAPVLAALCGDSAARLPFVQATLESAVTAAPGLTRLLPGRLRYSQHRTTVHAVPWQGSGDLSGTAKADCFLLLPEGADPMQAGDRVSVLLAP